MKLWKRDSRIKLDGEPKGRILTIRLSENQERKLAQYAERHGVGPSTLAREVLAEWIAQQEEVKGGPRK